MDQYERQIARLVQDAMDESEVSVKNLAVASGIRESRLRHLLTPGDCPPLTMRELASIADGLDRTVVELIPAA